MSITHEIKTGLIEILEWTEDSNDTMVWHAALHDHEIKYGAKLSVRDFQQAIFMFEGEVADTFKPGLYTLTWENLPILTIRNRWKAHDQHPFTAALYFIKTKFFLDQPWAFEKPVMLRDKNLGLVWLGASGTFDVRIIDPLKIIQKTSEEFTTHHVRDVVNRMMVTLLPDALHQSETSSEEHEGVAAFIQESINTELSSYGVMIKNLTVKTHDVRSKN